MWTGKQNRNIERCENLDIYLVIHENILYQYFTHNMSGCGCPLGVLQKRISVQYDHDGSRTGCGLLGRYLCSWGITQVNDCHVFKPVSNLDRLKTNGTCEKQLPIEIWPGLYIFIRNVYSILLCRLTCAACELSWPQMQSGGSSWIPPGLSCRSKALSTWDNPWRNRLGRRVSSTRSQCPRGTCSGSTKCRGIKGERKWLQLH